jgi:hypothetical protein
VEGQDLSNLFTSKYQPVNNILGGIRISTSLQGLPIPLVYGRTRIAPNLLWYGSFISVKFPTPGLSGSSGQTIGEYDYGAAVVLGLCQGPVQAIGSVWSGQGNLPVNETQETYTVPPGGGSYTVTQRATYLSDLGVTRGDQYTGLRGSKWNNPDRRTADPNAVWRPGDRLLHAQRDRQRHV